MLSDETRREMTENGKLRSRTAEKNSPACKPKSVHLISIDTLTNKVMKRVDYGQIA